MFGALVFVDNPQFVAWLEGDIVTDEDYWKRLYKGSWAFEAKRVAQIVERIRTATGQRVRPVGLGTGTCEFLSGRADKHGHERGAADLWVENTNVFLEVTGPQVEHVRPDAALWVRPDKVENARAHFPANDTWLVHALGMCGPIRVVRFNADFYCRLDRKQFRMIMPKLHGVLETYLEIPASDAVVRDFEILLSHLNSLHED